jgi:hypothetical protein
MISKLDAILMQVIIDVRDLFLVWTHIDGLRLPS